MMSITLLTLIPYIAVSLALLFCCWLFVSVKAEVRRLERRNLAEREERKRLERELHAMMYQLRSEVEVSVRDSLAAASTPALPAPRPSLNLNRRTQVLRLARRGERPEQIAAALGVPQNEVLLLLKLHEAGQRALPAPAQAGAVA